MTSPRFHFEKESAAQIVHHLGALKDTVSFPPFFIFIFFPQSAGQSKYEALHTNARLFQEPDNARLSRLSAAVTHPACVSAHV